MKLNYRSLIAVILVVGLQLTACGKVEEAVTEEPNVVVEHLEGAEPTRLTLTEDAARRIDVQTEPVGESQMGRTQMTQGEIVAAEDMKKIITAPNAGTILAPVADGIAVTGAGGSTSQVGFRLSSIEGLTSAGSAGSSVNMEVPKGMTLIKTLVSAGQFVEAGQPLFEVADTSKVWVMVKMTEAEFNRVDQSLYARVLTQDGSAADREAAPATIESGSSKNGNSFQLFYSLDNADHSLSLGQHVQVRLALAGSGAARRVIPYSSVIYDVNGNTWVYTATDALTFVRTPIDVDYIEGGQAFLNEGPASGSLVVTSGAEELYGSETEFEEE